MKYQHTLITLSNGRIVGNFSSPHPFMFEDGTILPAVPIEQAEELKVTFHEDIDPDNGDVELAFSLSPAIMEEMKYWWREYADENVHRVLCPLPMITAIKEEFGKAYLKMSPFRAIRIEDRINKLVSVSKFCL